MEIKLIGRRRSGKKSHKDRQSGHHKLTGKYVRQKIRTERNKAKARAKHLKNHPNDLQAIKNLK